MELKNNLSNFFLDKLETLAAEPFTKSYLVSIFINPIDISKNSVTILYSDAKMTGSFEKFQRLADGIFLAKTLFPKSLHHASSNYYNTIAQNSYYTCYRLMNKQWPVFEQLSDEFPYLVKAIQGLLNSTSHFQHDSIVP